MIGKILKYTLKAMAVLVAFILLVLLLLYMPFVQNFIKKEGVAYIEKKTRMHLSVDRIRLSFPLKLTIDNVLATLDDGDTLLRCETLDAHVALGPLLRKDVVVRKFVLGKTQVHFVDTMSNLDLKARLGGFALRTNHVELGERLADISSAELSDGDVFLSLGPSRTPADTLVADTAGLPWKLSAGQIKVNNVRFAMTSASPSAMRLDVALRSGVIGKAAVDLGEQRVAVRSVSLRQGDYTFLTDTARVEETLPRPQEEKEEPKEWTIRVDHILISDNRLKYGSLYGSPGPGLDVNHLEVSKLNLSADSVYNRGGAVRADIRSLSFRERSGLDVQTLKGRFEMDTVRIALSDFLLRTASSSLRANGYAGASALKMSPEAPLGLELSADMNLTEIGAILLPADDKIQKIVRGKSMTLNSRLSGTLGDLRIFPTELNVPGHVYLSLQGTLASVLDPKRLTGNCQIKGRFENLDFVKAFVPDTSLQKRIDIPRHIAFNGSLRASSGTLYPVLALAADSGTIALKGMFDPKAQRYQAELTADRFPLGRFLPRDSLGLLSMRLQAEGTGFDPFAESMSAQIGLKVDRLDYRGFDYRGVELNAGLKKHDLSGSLAVDNAAVQLALDIGGRLTKERQQARIKGSVDSCDLYGMNLTPERLSCSLGFDLAVSATDSQSYTLDLATERIRIRDKWRLNTIRPISVKAYAGRDRVEAAVGSGDLRLGFHSPAGTDSLVRGLSRISALIAEQIRAGGLDMRSIRDSIPPFRIELTAGRENILNNYLKIKGIQFDSLSLKTSTLGSEPFRLLAKIDRLASGGFVLDSVTTGLRQSDSRLNYFLRLANNPGNMDNVALIALFGYAEGNRVQLNCLQRTRSGEVGFDFGLNALWSDSTLTASMFPESPTLGFETWSVNAGNHVTYSLDGRIDADLALTRTGQRFSLQTVPAVDSTGKGLAVDITGIDIQSTLSLFPSAPPFGGILSADLVARKGAVAVRAEGNVSIKDLAYDKRRIGDVDLVMNYLPRAGGTEHADLKMSVDEKPALAVSGNYLPGDTLDLTVAFEGLPLAAANPFLPADLADLGGMLQGELRVAGPVKNVAIDGDLHFADTRVRVPMIGTTFGLSASPITIRNNDVIFNDFSVISPNKKPLSVDGSVRLGDFKNIMTDLRVRASDFQMINVKKNRFSTVYGTGFMDLDATVKGPLDELTIRGDVGLLGGTEITYVMRDSPLEVQNQKQNLVTFVSFRDTAAVQQADSLAPIRIGGIDMLVHVDVNNSAKLAVDLSEDGQNRIDLEGGGELTYTMNRLGDTRFSGKYVVTGGTVKYNPPVISQLVFKIKQGSFVEWTGEMADPLMNITATERVRANVSSDGQNDRPVNFDISINIRNTLDNLSITFDLAAPEDLTMQNQLSSLTAEQRAAQAMNLLIYNTYTGPGTTAKVSSSNPLNNFIEKELNQWAQNSLKGVDLSFGIDTYDDASGGGKGQRTDYSYQLSKNLFNNRLRAVIGGKVSSDADPDENLKDNLIDDISLEYMLTKRDNMFLKLFRHTGYESILEGEVTQTGLGFVIRKKLLKLSDLFRIMRNKVENTAPAAPANAQKTDEK